MARKWNDVEKGVIGLSARALVNEPPNQRTLDLAQVSADQAAHRLLRRRLDSNPRWTSRDCRGWYRKPRSRAKIHMTPARFGSRSRHVRRF